MAPEQSQQRAILLSEGQPTAFVDLLNLVMSDLSKEEQIAKITEILKRQYIRYDGKELPSLIWSLQVLFGLKGEGPEAFRAHLRVILNNTTKDKEKLWRNEFLPSDVAVAIFGKIIEGWRLDTDGRGRFIASNDAEKCFICVCKTYQFIKDRRQLDADNITKKLEEIFRLHLERSWCFPDTAKFLTVWIRRQKTPENLVRLMAHAQARYMDLADLKK